MALFQLLQKITVSSRKHIVGMATLGSQQKTNVLDAKGYLQIVSKTVVYNNVPMVS